MPPKRATVKARGKAPARNQPAVTIRAAARPGRSLKRRMIAKLIALEEEKGEPREMPRVVDIQGRYTRANVERYMGSRLGAGLEQREAAMARRRALESVGSDSDAGAPQSNRRRKRPRVRGDGEAGGQVVVEKGAKPPAEFMALPTEVRKMVYRRLLVSNGPIRVHSGWTIVYRRQPDGVSLDTAVLRTCKICYIEGMRVLYGENEFEYLIRDATPVPEDPKLVQDPETPRENNETTPLLTSRPEEEQNSDSEYDDYDNDAIPDVQVTATTTPPDSYDIDIPKVGPLMRRLGICAEANRSGAEYSQTMARAITTFATLSPTRANIHTLRIEVSTAWREETRDFALADWFTPGKGIMASLIKLPVRFIKFVIQTPSGRKVCAEVNRGYGTAIRRARRGDPRFVLENPALRREREDNAEREYGVLIGISGMITNEGWMDRLAGPEGGLEAGLAMEMGDD